MTGALRKLLMLIAVLLPVSMARAQHRVDYVINVCNQGKIGFDVASAERKVGAWAWSSPGDWNITGWTYIAPDKCAGVWRQNTWESGWTVNHPAVYLVFAFMDSTGVWGGIQLDVSKTNYKGRATNQKICVKHEAFDYDLPSGQRPTECTSGYYPMTATLWLDPAPTGEYVWGGVSKFSMDVALDAEERATKVGGPSSSSSSSSSSAGTSKDSSSDSSDEQGWKMAVDFLKAAAKAADEHRKQSDEAEKQATAQRVGHGEKENRERWAGSHQSPAAYGPQWMGQNIVVTGTVSRVEVAPGRPPWLTIYFKESPDATFVVCSPYPDMFQDRVGLDLSVLVGKTLEAAGQIEEAYCGHKVPKGSIRVVVSSQWQVQ